MKFLRMNHENCNRKRFTIFELLQVENEMIHEINGKQTVLINCSKIIKKKNVILITCDGICYK